MGLKYRSNYCSTTPASVDNWAEGSSPPRSTEPLNSFDGAVVSDEDGPDSGGVADDARDRLLLTVSSDDADNSASLDDSADSGSSLWSCYSPGSLESY